MRFILEWMRKFFAWIWESLYALVLHWFGWCVDFRKLFTSQFALVMMVTFEAFRPES